MTKEKVIAALKAGAKAFVVAFLGALGFAGFAPQTLDLVLGLLGLR